MDVDQALQLVWKAAARSSQAVVAAEIGVSPSALTHWKGGTVPDGVRRDRLIAWAEQQVIGAIPPADEVLKRAAELTAYNLTRLQEIRGYAKFVYDQLLMLAGKQGEIVAALEPYAGLEADTESERLRERAEATLRAATAAGPSGSASKPTRRKHPGQA